MTKFKNLVLSGFLILTMGIIGVLLSFSGVSAQNAGDLGSELSGILFSSDRRGSGRAIFLMDENGKEVQSITTNAIRGDNMVSLSPNKQRLMFATYRFGGWKLAQSDADGGNIKRLTTSHGYETSSSFSHNGEMIVYSKIDGPGQGYTKLYLADADGKIIRQLTHPNMHNVKPVFSPDDSKILFEQYDYKRSGSTSANILELNIKSNKLRTLTSNVDDLIFAPSYSPDGNYIAYLGVRENKSVFLGMMDAEGNDHRILTENIGMYTGGEEQFFMRTDWNSEGNFVVFSVYDGSDYELYKIDITNLRLTQLTDNQFDDVQPFWIK
ncbi:MAG: hypothetical protein Tsb0034_11610 [Ekhidna sp.]